MKKPYQYKLKTISHIILSPRQQACFYLCAGDFTIPEHEKDINSIKENVNLIYPFYRYGDYKEYNPDLAQYYIPGSSLKEAIGNQNIMVDDIIVPASAIALRPLWKAQYIHESEDIENNQNIKQAKIEHFFPNLAIEMLIRNKILSGVIYSDSDMAPILLEAQHKTVEKLKQLSRKLDGLLKEGFHFNLSSGKECKDSLMKLQGNMNNLIQNIYTSESKNEMTYYIFLGGYKGLLLSSIFPDLNKIDEYAIYLDKSCYLPYGLVQIEWKGVSSS